MTSKRPMSAPPLSLLPVAQERVRASDLEQIEKQLRGNAAQGDVFAYIKHEESPQGALQAAPCLPG